MTVRTRTVHYMQQDGMMAYNNTYTYMYMEGMHSIIIVACNHLLSIHEGLIQF